MIKQTRDWERLGQDMQAFSDEWEGFEPQELIRGCNLLLTDGEGNYSLFEYVKAGVYEGHYLFSRARGITALRLAKEMLDFLFKTYPDVKMILGKTPEEHKGAIQMNKALGFNKYGVEKINGEKFILVSLSKERYENK